MKKPITTLLLILMSSLFAVKASEDLPETTFVEQLEEHRLYNRKYFYYTNSIDEVFEFMQNIQKQRDENNDTPLSKPDIMFVIDLSNLQWNKKYFESIIAAIPDLHILVDISNAQTIGHHFISKILLPDNLEHLHLIATKNNVRELGMNSVATRNIHNEQKVKSLKTLEICIPSLRTVSSDVISAFTELETVRIYGDGFYIGNELCPNPEVVTTAIILNGQDHLGWVNTWPAENPLIRHIQIKKRIISSENRNRIESMNSNSFRSS